MVVVPRKLLGTGNAVGAGFHNRALSLQASKGDFSDVHGKEGMGDLGLSQLLGDDLAPDTLAAIIFRLHRVAAQGHPSVLLCSL